MLLSLLLLIIITFIPVLLWGYIFSYLDNDTLNRKRFFFWILAWGLSVVPILYLENIVNFSWIDILNIFYYISDIVWILWIIRIIFSLFTFTLLVLIISFLFWISFWNILEKLKKYIKLIFKMLLVFIFLILIITFIIVWFDFIITLLPFLQFDVSDNWIMFKWIAFDSFKLVLFYYIIIWFIEEISKHFNFLQTDIFWIDTVKKWVLYWIFIALGFSFVENILYLYNIYESDWFGWNFLTTYFFRSIFSVFLHVICTWIISLYFTKAFIYYRENKLNYSFLKLVTTWFLLSIWLHALFDISLTFWFTFIIFLYFIFWYIYISGIFYKE